MARPPPDIGVYMVNSGAGEVQKFPTQFALLGSRRLARMLQEEEHPINRKRMQRLMRDRRPHQALGHRTRLARGHHRAASGARLRHDAAFGQRCALPTCTQAQPK